VFFPPPKVKSAVIRLKRNNVEQLPCSDDYFVTVVKTAFNQRRKMMRNSLKSICEEIPEIYADKRPEQLSVADFIELTRLIENLIKK
jgi:16S rRNA (adenine1518-N6/adenine1519-N6)-dimethyltransferase